MVFYLFGSLHSTFLLPPRFCIYNGYATTDDDGCVCSIIMRFLCIFARAGFAITAEKSQIIYFSLCGSIWHNISPTQALMHVLFREKNINE